MSNKILIWLSGKKSIIAGIITTTASYLADVGVIGTKDAVFIAAISLIIFGSASVATSQMYKSQN